MEDVTLTSPRSTPIDEIGEASLRPYNLDEYVGQRQLIDTITIAIASARARKGTLDHILLYGPPGLGKTSLAFVIARELGSDVRLAAGPTLTRPGDIASILTNLSDGDVLFIDEIHRMPRAVEETLYPALEDSALDVLLGKGPGARSVRLNLPKFTLVGATTRAASLSQPLRDRFGISYRLEYYSLEELVEILTRSSRKLGISLSEAAASTLASRSRRTPRIANRLLRRVRDFTVASGRNSIDTAITESALDQLRIDTLGLDQSDRELLHILAHTFKGKPVGLETLSAASGEDKETLEDIVEPFLIQQGLIERTPRGRVITETGISHLDHYAVSR